ncbi:MAG: T9SS type A sorting domain-containing protein, partial [Bacteroidota bacterium]
PITYRFIVENTGNVALTNVELEDDLVGFECNQSLANIPVGQSLTVDCTWPYGFAESTEPYVNTATVSSTVTVGGETKTVSVSNTASIMINSQIPLPVELLVFKVTAQAEHISLPWSTASEINNDRFVLERSEDAKFFKVIGELKGQGTTLSKNQYDYQDEEVISNVMYYYRIKQVDFDGAFEYSPTVNVIIKDDNKATKLYPNPVREDGFLKLEGLNSSGEVTIIISNLLGQRVKEIKQLVGRNIRQQVEINVSDLGAGTYFLNIGNGEILQFTKIE